MIEVRDQETMKEVRATLPSGRTVSVEVHGPYRAFNTQQPAKVNWPGIGSVGAEDALVFALAVKRAVEIAQEWAS